MSGTFEDQRMEADRALDAAEDRAMRHRADLEVAAINAKVEADVAAELAAGLPKRKVGEGW